MHRQGLSESKASDTSCPHLCGARRSLSPAHPRQRLPLFIFLEAPCTSHDHPPPIPTDPQLYLPIPQARLCSSQLLRLLYCIIPPPAASMRRFGAEKPCFGACFCNPPVLGSLQLPLTQPSLQHIPDVLSTGSKSRK